MPIIVCPQCNKDDAIQKISAIVDAGKSNGSYSGSSTSQVSIDGKSGASYGYSFLSGSSMTELTKLLIPPTPYKYEDVSIGSFLLFILIGFFTLSLIIWALLAIFFNLIQNIYGAIIFVVIELGSLYVVFLLIRSIRSTKELEQENKIKYQDEEAKWKSALQRWNRLYYCHRNGIVFDPETNETCEPANIKTFIYQHYQSKSKI